MITEDYISFEVTKRLKEKGFDEPCYRYYDNKGDVCAKFINPDIPLDYSSREYYLCPSQSMAMKWFREKYNIYISVQPDFPSDKDYKMCWCWSASILHENCISIKAYQCNIETYEEATEAAIKYCLENLI